MSAGARLDAARARAFGGGAAAYGAVACPTAAAAARTSVVACSGAVEMKADSIVTDVQTFFSGTGLRIAVYRVGRSESGE